ncbi:hypothetical protein Pan153_02070 [Gimesia panareensis]|uniref:Uncharacterized protein n=1 Tax=Gimesia panareensis TaxID=2527978 RepID=A0A518FGY2_9PLAN|nr:hypothetical protein Pan153_02070 [Gimesia panareensis]
MLSQLSYSAECLNTPRRWDLNPQPLVGDVLPFGSRLCFHVTLSASIPVNFQSFSLLECMRSVSDRSSAACITNRRSGEPEFLRCSTIELQRDMFENGAGGNRTHNPRVLSHVLQIGSRLRTFQNPTKWMSRFNCRSYRSHVRPTVGTRQTISERCRCVHAPWITPGSLP